MVTRPDNSSEAFALSDSNVTPDSPASFTRASSSVQSYPAAAPDHQPDRRSLSSHTHRFQSTSFTYHGDNQPADREQDEEQEESPLLDQATQQSHDDRVLNDSLCASKSLRNTKKCYHVDGCECTSLLPQQQQQQLPLDRVHSDCETSEQLHHLPSSLSSTLESSTHGISSASNASSSSPSHNHTDKHDVNAHGCYFTACVHSTPGVNENIKHPQVASSSSVSSSSSSPSSSSSSSTKSTSTSRAGSTCTSVSSSSHLSPRRNLWRTFVYIFWLLVVVLVISFSCLGSYVNTKERKVVSGSSSIGNNLPQELIFNASNINNLTVHNIKSSKDSLLFNNKSNNDNNNNDTFENKESNKLLFSMTGALIMIPNVTSSSNSQQKHHSIIDITSPSVSTLFSTHHSERFHQSFSSPRLNGPRSTTPHSCAYGHSKCKDSSRRKNKHSRHHKRHKRVRCKNITKSSANYDRHHRCDLSSYPATESSTHVDNSPSSERSPLNQRPSFLSNDDDDNNKKGQMIAVENLVMTSSPNNFTDEDDLAASTTAASASDEHIDTTTPLSNRSFAVSHSPFSRYPIATGSLSEATTVTLATSEVKDDDLDSALTSSRENKISSSSASSFSSSSSQEKASSHVPSMSSIEKARGVPALPYFFLNPCSGYAVSLTDSNRLNAIHEVPVETHQLIANLTRGRARWTRHLTSRGLNNDKLSLLWYFQKKFASSPRKSKESMKRHYGSILLDVLTQSGKRVSRSAHHASQVSSEASSSSSTSNNFASAVWILQSYTYSVKGSVQFAVTIQSKSGAFICFGKRGKLVTKSSGNSAYCMFNDRKIGGFYTYSSIVKPEWTIGFDCHGKPIHHHQVTRKKNRSSSKHKSTDSCLSRDEDDYPDEEDDQFKNRGKCFQFLRVNVPPSLLTS